MRILDRVTEGLAFLDRSVFQLCGIFMFCLMAVGALDVVLNNTIGYGAPGAIDISQALFVCSVFLALPIVARQNDHIKVDLFTNLFSPRMNRIAGAISGIIGAGIYLVLAYAMWDLFRASWRVNEQSLSVFSFPIYPVKFLAFFGLALAVLAAIAQVAGIFRSRN
jgi:TRAP-type C4-dicarboxylate transport system permease small subunit